ncbi:MarR family transcriptional regulator [Nocardia sp. NBC_00565]|uniref:MarR family winged helix-turn-helix transcriptional regulator n=1 Tax=Nocardia sp. NBC_00565 TaxID=2975993 RepID=UPI002E824995|nr:MarR family transcriptional regulator [Nocardia sp. NBC_00565]WUC06684.1 MarR family transcriptional regulator [Nocardia sp. NBC_00565]
MTKRDSTEPTLDSDPIEFVRQNWAKAGQRQTEQFAAAISIFRMHQLISAEFGRTLKPYRINRTAYHVMSALFMSAEMTRPLGQLGKNVMVHPATLTLIIDQLETRGLVRRSPHPTDRRTTLATLTEAGAHLVGEASAALADANFGLAETTDDDARKLNDSLRRARKSLDDTIE